MLDLWNQGQKNLAPETTQPAPPGPPGHSIIPAGYALSLTARSTQGTKIGMNLGWYKTTGDPKVSKNKHRKTETKMIQHDPKNVESGWFKHV